MRKGIQLRAVRRVYRPKKESEDRRGSEERMRERERMEFRMARTQISPGDGYIPMRDRFFQPNPILRIPRRGSLSLIHGWCAATRQ